MVSAQIRSREGRLTSGLWQDQEWQPTFPCLLSHFIHLKIGHPGISTENALGPTTKKQSKGEMTQT